MGQFHFEIALGPVDTNSPAAKPPFSKWPRCSKKIDLTVCSIRFRPIFSCASPFGKDRLFVVGILGLTGPNDEERRLPPGCKKSGGIFPRFFKLKQTGPDGLHFGVFRGFQMPWRQVGEQVRQ